MVIVIWEVSIRKAWSRLARSDGFAAAGGGGGGDIAVDGDEDEDEDGKSD